MNVRILLVLSVVLFFAASMAIPVMAFEFRLNDFKTDKLVYEVGESVFMVSNLTAEFSPDGWCHTSFFIVTDLGPVYEDGRFINSSSSYQLITSSYLILPNTTAPGSSGINASAILNVEIWDPSGSSGVISKTVNFTILRGSLNITVMSPLDIQYGTNTTLCLLVSSIHNPTVVLDSKSIVLSIFNSQDMLVYNATHVTNKSGIVEVSLPSATWSPDTYTIKVAFAGDMVFLPFTKFLNLVIQLPESMINIYEADESVLCISSDGLEFDYFNVTILHLSLDFTPILGSSVLWTTSFSNGLFNEVSDGLYSTSVPFLVPPGLYRFNITAENSAYRAATYSMVVSVQHRPLSANIQLIHPPIAGNTLDIVVHTTDVVTHHNVSLIPMKLEVIVNETVFTSLIGTSNSSGYFFCSILIPESLYGPGSLHLIINESEFYTAVYKTLQFQVNTIPCFNITHPFPLIIGEAAEIIIYVTSPSGLPLSDIQIEIFYEEYLVGQSITNATGYASINWSISREISCGPHFFKLHSLADPSAFIADTEFIFPLTFQHWVQLTSFIVTECNRNGNLSFTIVIDCDPAAGNPILNISISDDVGDISFLLLVETGLPVSISIPLGASVMLGPHTLTILCLNNDFAFSTTQQVPIDVRGHIYTTVEYSIFFYCETAQIQIYARDDIDLPLTQFELVLTIDEHIVLYQMENASSGQSIDVLLTTLISPGPHTLTINVRSQYMTPLNMSFVVFVWIRTSMSFTVSHQDLKSMVSSTQGVNTIQPVFITASISSGSIIRPPPILFSGTTLTESPTHLLTSSESCPKLSSGTNNLSTVLENFRTSSSGNGHMPLSFIDFTLTFFELDATTTSSTEREVHPKDIMPHSASRGPCTTKSLRIPLASSIFLLSRLTNLS